MSTELRFALVLAGILFNQAATAAGSAEKGKAAYVQHGCWQCHGFAGQGGVTGPKLAPTTFRGSVGGISQMLRVTRCSGPSIEYGNSPVSN